MTAMQSISALLGLVMASLTQLRGHYGRWVHRPNLNDTIISRS